MRQIVDSVPAVASAGTHLRANSHRPAPNLDELVRRLLDEGSTTMHSAAQSQREQ